MKSRHLHFKVPPSKSIAIRSLICQALSGETPILSEEDKETICDDIRFAQICSVELYHAIHQNLNCCYDLKTSSSACKRYDEKHEKKHCERNDKEHESPVFVCGESATLFRILLVVSVALHLNADFIVCKGLLNRVYPEIRNIVGAKATTKKESIFHRLKNAEDFLSEAKTVAKRERVFKNLTNTEDFLTEAKTVAKRESIFRSLTNAEDFLNERVKESVYGGVLCKFLDYGDTFFSLKIKSNVGLQFFENISASTSQYYSGLLMSMPLNDNIQKVEIPTEQASSGYIEITQEVMSLYGIEFIETGKEGIRNGVKSYQIKRPSRYVNPKESPLIERDFSSSAYLICMAIAKGENILIRNLHKDSKQPDREIVEILKRSGAEIGFTFEPLREPKGHMDYPQKCTSGCIKINASEGLKLEDEPDLSFNSNENQDNVYKMNKNFAEEVSNSEMADEDIEHSGLWVNGSRVEAKDLSGFHVDASRTPDLICAVAALACIAKSKTVIKNIDRLRFKESDRKGGIRRLVESAGGSVEMKGNDLLIIPAHEIRTSVSIKSEDHRILMMAEILSELSKRNHVSSEGEMPEGWRICDESRIAKSYPQFLRDVSKMKR